MNLMILKSDSYYQQGYSLLLTSDTAKSSINHFELPQESQYPEWFSDYKQ